jgi:hypothetical protein
MSNVVQLRRGVQFVTTAEIDAEIRQQADMAVSAFIFDLVKLIGVKQTAQALDDAATRLRELAKGANQ